MCCMVSDAKFVHQLLKKLLVIGLSLCYSVQAMSAQDTGPVTLDMQNVSIERVLNTLKSKYGLSFVMRTDGIDLSRKVTVEVKNRSLQAVLDQIFASQNIRAEINDNVIRLSLRTASTADLEPYTVRGRVTDENGAGIPGASNLYRHTFLVKLRQRNHPYPRRGCLLARGSGIA